MKTKKLIFTALISAGLAVGMTAQAKEKEEEQAINTSDVPQGVQQAAQAAAKGGTILRWEKEGPMMKSSSRKTVKKSVSKSTRTAKS